jgi:CRISPR/Cas system-associated protein Cas7 (RAMP superfamily)
MSENSRAPFYEMSFNVLAAWQAHSLSTAGSNGSNRVLPRRQLLADKSETDACSGNIAKRHHAALVAAYFAAEGNPLCPACRVGDGRRAAALVDRPEYGNLSFERIVCECALCDTHGFLVTAKNADSETSTGARQKISKETLIDFSYALALPERHAETSQLHTRNGASKEEGQMLMKIPARSGEYALCIRYRCVGIGADTEQWLLYVKDQALREKRHRAVLRTLRDTLVSPDGAQVATMLPHLTRLSGAIVVRTGVGRAPLYSALDSNFVTCLQSMADETCQVYPFETIDAFYRLMNTFIATSVPALHPLWKTSQSSNAEIARTRSIFLESAVSRCASHRGTAPGKRVSPYSGRVCGALLHSAIQPFFPAVCNGKPYRATESHTSCNGKVDFTAKRRSSSSQHCYLMIPYCTFMSKMRSTD